MSIDTRYQGWPHEWTRIPLAAAAVDGRENFIDGDWIEAPYITDHGIRLIQTGNIGIGVLLDKPETRKYISPKSFNELRCKWVHPGDILICRLAEPIGRSCKVPQNIGDCVTSVDVTIFRPDPKRLDCNYAIHLLNSESHLKKLLDVAGGSTRQRISRGNLARLEICIPSVNEQRRIAKILDTLDNTIQKTELLIAKLKQIKQGLLHDLLTRGIDENGQLRDPIAHPEQFKDSQLGRIPGSWDVVPIGAIGDVVTGSTPPSSAPDAWGELSPFVTPGEISEGSIARSERGLSKKGLAFVRMIPAGATLVVCIGSTLGKTAQASEECTTNQQINAVIPSDTFDASYVYHAISAHIYQLFRIAGLQAIPIVNKSQFSKILVPLAPPVEQVRIAQMVRSQDARLRAENKYLAKLNRLKKGLMHDLITGKVRVTSIGG